MSEKSKGRGKKRSSVHWHLKGGVLQRKKRTKSLKGGGRLKIPASWEERTQCLNQGGGTNSWVALKR